MQTRIGILFATLVTAPSLHAQVSYTGGTYTQNFDTLATTGNSNTWTNNTTLPGWSLFRTDGTAITTYNAGTGSSNVGAFYSFGVAGVNGVTERALGGVGSVSVNGYIAVGLTNNTGSTITSATASFEGEQWRNSGSNTPNTMLSEFGTGATYAAVGATWAATPSSFNFVSPVSIGSAGALDGNAGANRVTNLGGVLDFSPIGGLANGQTVWIRWQESDDTGLDHGLAIDNFSFAPVPEPATVGLIAAGVMGVGAGVRRRKR